jgi:hypothetical protein
MNLFYGPGRDKEVSIATDTIDYVATDTWGNTSTSTRTIIIIDAAAASSSTQ